MSRPICIYHGGCADGFTAAWVVWKRLGGDIDFFPAAYGDAPPAVTGRDVIIVDFSYKRPVIEAMAATARSVLILDHHRTAAQELAGLLAPSYDCTSADHYADTMEWVEEDPGENLFATFDIERSGAQIAFDFFWPKERLRAPLVEVVADRDLWRFDLPDTREISAAIYSRDFGFDVWDDLDWRLISQDARRELVAEGKALLRQHDKNVASVIRNTRQLMKIGGHLVPVANAPHFLASDAGNILAEGQSFGATYFDGPLARVFSLRSRQDGIDVSEIAAGYGGGGHKNAAGFQIARGWEGEP